jgi:hypothetical protein
MMSWEARSKITNLSQLSPNNNTSSTSKILVKESFWVITTNAWGSYFSLIFHWNCDCVFLDLPRCCELAVFGRVLVIVLIFLQLLGKKKKFFFFFFFCNLRCSRSLVHLPETARMAHLRKSTYTYDLLA